MLHCCWVNSELGLAPWPAAAAGDAGGRGVGNVAPLSRVLSRQIPAPAGLFSESSAQPSLRPVPDSSVSPGQHPPQPLGCGLGLADF